MASSPLPWTGTNAIRIIGYSLGGGIAAHFAETFPHMVSSLVLLAPAGLIRAERFGRITTFVFSSGFIPERILARLTSARLQQPIASSRKVPKENTKKKVDPDAPVTEQPLQNKVTHYARWMVTHHIGFVPAFMSCIRHAPLVSRHHVFEALAKRDAGSTVVLLAEKDEIINLHDYETDGLPLLGGKDHVVWKVLPGGHDFVMTHHREILQVLDKEWDMKAGK